MSRGSRELAETVGWRPDLNVRLFALRPAPDPSSIREPGAIADVLPPDEPSRPRAHTGNVERSEGISRATDSEASFFQEGHLGAPKRRVMAGRIVVLDPGSGRTEEPVSGCEPVALAIGVAPGCPPGSAMSPARIDDELAIYDVRDVALEGA